MICSLLLSHHKGDSVITAVKVQVSSLNLLTIVDSEHLSEHHSLMFNHAAFSILTSQQVWSSSVS